MTGNQTGESMITKRNAKILMSGENKKLLKRVKKLKK